MIKFSTKIKKLNNLATACANAGSNDFKALWYHKLIDLAKEYNMLDYVMRKVIHWRMTVTDKDAKDFQKMVDKLEKQNKKAKKDEEKDKEIKEKQTLDNPDQVWYNNVIFEVKNCQLFTAWDLTGKRKKQYDTKRLRHKSVNAEKNCWNN